MLYTFVLLSIICGIAAHANRVYRYPYSNVNFHLTRHSIFAPIVAECFPLHGGLNVNSGKHTHTDRQSCIYICTREGRDTYVASCSIPRECNTVGRLGSE